MPPSALRQLVRQYKRHRLEQRLRVATGEEVKRANCDLNWREFWHQQTHLRSRPRLVQVGTNWTCNLKCNFCRLTMDSTQRALKARPPRELEISDKVYDAVIDLMPYPELLILTPLGEPMLYSKFGKILEHHARLGSRNLAMTSNVNLVNDDKARMLVEGQMSHMFVSVDSCDPAIYESMRVRGTLEKVEAALESINRWKEKLNSSTPTLTLASTFMERNVRQMPDMVDFALKHKFKELNLQLMEVENEELESEYLGHHLPLLKEMLMKTVRRATEKGLPLKAELGFRNMLSKHLSGEEFFALTRLTQGQTGDATAAETGTDTGASSFSTQGKKLIEKCHYPWYYMLIDTDGDCRPCCWAGASYGNLNNGDLESVWNGEHTVQMRRDFLNNHIPKGCQGKHCRVDLDHSGTME